MAIYEYEILDNDGNAVGIYETQQKMSDPALTHHPETGQPLKRILSATFAHGSKSTGPTAAPCESGACGLPGGGFGGCPGGVCGLN